MTSPCKQIQEQLAGYVDRELEPAEAKTVSRHLQDCAGCAEEADAQEKIKNLVRAKSAPVAAPAHLRAEIRRHLDQENSAFSFWRQLRQLFVLQPVAALATVVALIFLSGLLTYFVFLKTSPLAGGDAPFTTGSIEGEIICIDCDLLDLVKAAYVHDAAHRVGVRCKDGQLWSILRSEKSQELSSQMHRQVRIVGNLFENAQYVKISEFSVI